MSARSTFLTAYGGGHVAMLAPIASAFASAGRPFTFLALTTARPYLERLGIPAIGFRDLPGADDSDVQAFGRALAADFPDGGLVAPEETVAYLGACFRDLVHDVGEAEAWRRYRIAGRQAFLPVRTLENTLRVLAPSLVVATNSPRAEQAAILAAGRIGIPSICAVDLFALREVEWIGQPGYADRVCVLNECVREMFLTHGRLPYEIVVTGNPAFDRLVAPETLAQGAALRRERGWDDGRTTLLWASQIEPQRHPATNLNATPSLPRRIEEVLRSFVAEYPEYRLVVRYHPSERVEFMPGERVEFSPTRESISVLLHAVDVVVITASTVGLEASIAGRPVISVNNSVLSPDMMYTRMGVSVCVDNASDLPQALLALGKPGRAMSGATQLNSNSTATQKVMSVVDHFLT
jgi:hypothetical protein